MKNEENMDELLKGMCKWLKEVKGITEIEMMDMVRMLPEYEEYMKQQNPKP